jgi:DNA-binding IscR family transcriptional regulator
VAEVIRPLDGPLAEVRGLRPEAATYEGPAEHLQDVWVAVRASLRSVLEQVSIADIVSGQLPRSVQKLTTDPDSWRSR